jgi:hypothetical protein
LSQKKRGLSAAKTLKNKIRGASSSLKNKTPPRTAGTYVTVQRHALKSMNHAIGAARSSFRGESLHEFEKWVSGQYQLSNQDTGIAVPKELLGILPESLKPRSLQSELENTLLTIRREARKIELFLVFLSKLSTEIELGRFENSLALVEQHIQSVGYSYWAIETKIAILSTIGRSASAKEFIAQLSAGPFGLNSFYFYHIGLRNESSQSTARFKALIARRLNDSKLAKEYITYASYRVAREIPTNPATLATILAYEGFSTKIDVYLTSTRIAYEILTNQEVYKPIEIQLCKDLLAAIHESPYLIKAEEIGVFLSESLSTEIQAAIQSTLVPSEIQESGYSFRKGISATISLSGSEADEESHRKYLQNFWWIPESMLIDSAGRIPRLVELYSNTWNPSEKVNHPFVRACIQHFNEWAMREPLGSPSNWDVDYCAAPAWYDRKDLSSAITDCLSVRAAWEALRNDKHKEVLRLSQFALFLNPRLLEVLPLEAIFKGISYREISNYGAGIDVCNCLHWYSQQSSERQIRTFKRFAIEEWVESSGFESIVEAAQALVVSNQFPQVVEFFIYATCDLSTVELLLEVESTKDAKAIRAKLLKLCTKTGSSSADHIAAEAEELLEQLVVDEVLEEIDETMVSVDEEALLPAVAREIAADFERYKQLIAAEQSSKSSIDALMKSLRQQSATAFQIPESESADLLVQMVRTVLDRFMDDPVYGLDAIIGRRIRHGTISSELRGTLEQRSLIGQRPRSGADYDVPGEVAKYIQQFDSNKRRGIGRAFSRFSSAIDNLVAQLRDEVFQCKQKGKLEAAFELPISTPMFAFAADVASESQSVDVFCDALFQTFWLLLSIRIERDRHGTKEYIERVLQEAFQKFSEEMKTAKFSDVEFHSSLQQASEELQLKASLIANWIRIPQVNNEDRTFQLPLVFDAAMASCKSRRAGFDPSPTQEIEAGVSLNAHEYRIVFDALCIALENVAEHSGIKKGNRIHTIIARSADGERLCFSIASDIGKGVWNSDRQVRVDSIRDEISRESFADRARRTKGSGIAKIATIIRKHENCQIEFQATDGGLKFNLYFELRHKPRSTSISIIKVSEEAM